MSSKKLTISIHFGKKIIIRFFRKFSKIFSDHNTYPNIRMIITETVETYR